MTSHFRKLVEVCLSWGSLDQPIGQLYNVHIYKWEKGCCWKHRSGLATQSGDDVRHQKVPQTVTLTGAHCPLPSSQPTAKSSEKPGKYSEGRWGEGSASLHWTPRTAWQHLVRSIISQWGPAEWVVLTSNWASQHCSHHGTDQGEKEVEGFLQRWQ